MPDVLRDDQNLQFSLSAKFNATYRLLRENGFDHVIGAENISDRHIKIFYVYNRKKNARLGMVLGKKILPSAIDRNRVKRIIREAFRQHSIKRLNLDIVVMLRHAGTKKGNVQPGNLKVMFSCVENRCVDL